MSKKLYVGNLSYNLSEGQLTDAFTPFGSVVSTKIITDQMTGRNRGFGFVEMETPDEANAAVDGLNGKEVEGRPLKVDIATERKPGARGGQRRDGGYR